MGPGCPITARMHTIDTEARDALGSLSGPVRDWFAGAFPEGPTPAQRLAWPPIAAGEHMLLVSPTGTGKTLAGFLAILDRLFRAAMPRARSAPGLRCVYISPLRSLGYDIERNLAIPLGGNRATSRVSASSPDPRRRADGRYLGLLPPQAPGPAAPYLDHDAGESLALAQPGKLGRSLARGRAHHRGRGARAWCPPSAGPTWRSRSSGSQPRRIAIPAGSDSRPPAGLPSPWRGSWWGRREPAAWSKRPCPAARRPWRSRSRRCWSAGEAPHRGLTYRRLIRRLRQVMKVNRTTVIFANTRPFTEKITHDLRHDPKPRDACADGETQGDVSEPAVAAHHSALDASRRQSGGVIAQAGPAQGRGDQHEPGAGCRYRHGRPDGPGRPAGRRGPLRAAGGAVGPSPGGGLAGLDTCGHRGRDRRRRRDGAGRAGRPAGTAAHGRGPARRRLPAASGHGLRGRMRRRAGLHAVAQGRSDGRAGKARFRRLPRFSGRRSGRAAGCLRARARRGSALVFAADLEAQRLVRSSRPPRHALVLDERRHDHLGRDRAGSGRRRGHRHARGRLCRAAGSRRPVRARWPLAGIPAPRGIGHSGSSGRRRARAADLAQRSPVALVGAGPRGCRVPRRGSQAADAGRGRWPCGPG